MSATEAQLNLLSEQVLALYSRAARLQRLDVAELLLQALERLAEASAECEDCRDAAYLALAESTVRLPNS